MTTAATTTTDPRRQITRSSRVRAKDFRQSWFLDRCKEMAIEPRLHRKIWEFAIIAQTILERVPPGGKILGFGCGREPLPSWLASKGYYVLATDFTEARPEWRDTGQQALSLGDLLHSEICDARTLNAHVTFSPLDMRDIPESLLDGRFDATYSAGSFEHIGGLTAGIQFFTRQMLCLKPGGVAVHTTEFNPDSKRTLDLSDLCLYRRQELESLAEALSDQDLGHLLELDLLPGGTDDDVFIDAPPYTEDRHLNLYIGGYLTTSVVLIADRKREEPKKEELRSQEPILVESVTTPKRVLWVGDAVVSSGFSKCTHYVCNHLHYSGWDVQVLGLNYYGDPHSYPYTILPCFNPLDSGIDYFGTGRLPLQIERLNPDVVVILNDPWNIPGYVNAINSSLVARERAGLPLPSSIPPIIPWLAVDAMNQKGWELNHPWIKEIVVWTTFAKEQLLSTGCEAPISIVPLGVDTSIFHPMDKTEARKIALRGIDDPFFHDAYIVGYIGRNQERKRLDLLIRYFANWVQSPANRNRDNAILYICTAPTGDRGFDLESLVHYYNLRERVIVANPPIGYGYSEPDLCAVYNSFDVFATTSQAEGWCLPALEAMACGVPVIAPDNSAFSCWAKGAAYLARCSGTAITAPANSKMYTVGLVPDEENFVGLLETLYLNRNPQAIADRGKDRRKDPLLYCADRFSWSSAAEKFRVKLDEVVTRARAQRKDEEMGADESSTPDSASNWRLVAHGQ